MEQQEGKEEFSALPYLLLSYIRENDVRVTLALNHFSFAHSLFVKLFLANFGRSISWREDILRFGIFYKVINVNKQALSLK